MTNTSAQINDKLGKKRLFYVSRDAERAAAGLFLDLPNYGIITNNSPYAKRLKSRYDDVFIADEDKTLTTWQLLKTPKIKDILQPGDYVLIFKSTPQIEDICRQNHWHLLNPSAALASEVEQKISQVKWLGPLTKYLPPFRVDICKNIKWEGKKFILQFNRAHTGSGTILIASKEQLDEIIKKFPERDARVTKYIQGPFFTNNNVVWGNKIIIGNINYQITGLKPFTDNPFATVGNDWALPHKILNKKQIAAYKKIATDVGRRLQKSGWKGLFGIDTVLEEKTGKIYLIEINARQPASTTYESVLQKKNSVFEAHLASLLDIDPNKFTLTKISDGAQIIQRITKEIPKMHEPKVPEQIELGYIYYDNTFPNSDLLRIQTKTGLMRAHNKLNKLGLEAIDLVICGRSGNRWNAPRAGAILIQDGKVLLMKRHKYGRNYFTIPGGTMEAEETPLQIAQREILEETGLTFEPSMAKPIHFKRKGRDEYYFVGQNIQGTAKLGGPEKEISTQDYSYELKWVDINEIKNINLLPKSIIKYVLKYKKSV